MHLGIFGDHAAIAGVSYRTASLSGTTDANGQFEYRDGETVVFSVGGVELGQGAAGPGMGLSDLAVDVPSATSVDGIEKAMAGNAGYQRLFNVTLLLLTLDTDGRADNGIVIDNSVTELLRDAVIEFHKHPDEFARDPGFRSALTRANLLNLFAGHRAPVHNWDVLAHLYAGTDTDIPQTLTQVRTYAGFAPATRQLQKMVSYSYNEQGQLAARITVNHGVPASDQITWFNYDDQGLVAQIRHDSNGDGVANRIVTNSFDINRQLIVQETDENGDGTADIRFWFDYDNHGNLIAEHYDLNQDGQPDGYAQRQFDGAGNVLAVAEYAVDENGLATRFFGRADQYDSLNRMVRSAIDDDGDGNDESTIEYHYDAGGKLVSLVSSDSAGSVTTRYQYDDQGNRVSEQVSDAGGTTTAMQTWSYVYDGNGNIVRESADTNGDGMLDQITRNDYDALGNRIRSERDDHADGTVDAVIEYDYEPAGGWRHLFSATVARSLAIAN